MEARQASASGGAIGLIFGARAVGDQREYYQFVVKPDAGEYLLEKHDLNGNWTTLIDWTNSAVILGGTDMNSLRVDRIGNQIYLWVNDTMVASHSDGELAGPGNDAGLRAYSYEAAPVEVRFDNFRVSSIP